MDYLPLLEKDKMPKHVAIIMDGNGRWAKERGEDRVFGHHQGVLSVRDIVNASAEAGVQYLTLYAFSTENWNRPKEEVDALMELLVNTIRREVDELKEKGVRMHLIGDLASLPAICQQEMQEACDITAHNTRIHLILALSYSSRWEITQATKAISIKVANGEMTADSITDEVFSQHLSTAAFPDPELMIRTSGEHRISNFLLYQLAYAELYFTNTHWPDFRAPSLYEALYDYQNRERRFGKTSEQLQPLPPTTQHV